MGKTALPSDFKDFLKLLNYHKVDYLLVGGYAVGYHGYPRATGDIDIWIRTSRENAEKLVIVLKEFGFDLPEINDSLFLEKDKVLRMGNTPIRIELLTSISGVDFQDCYEQRVEDLIDNVEVKIIDFVNLKKNKLASGRHKDLDDLENLP
ncbi:MAG: hypothetical protein ACYTFY_12880 [Planctomycetota bacterium]|jgi:hypothetical protein